MKSSAMTDMKRVMIIIGMLLLVCIGAACSKDEEEIKSSVQPTDQPPIAHEEGQKPEEQTLTQFDQQVQLLTNKGLELPGMSPDSTMTGIAFVQLLIEGYEALGAEIDLSYVNPEYDAHDAIKKASLLGVIDLSFLDEKQFNTEIDYGTAAYWLLKLQDTIQKRLYHREDSTATAGDLLQRINTSIALHTWTSDISNVSDVSNMKEPSTFTLNELMESDAAVDQRLTRLMAAEMMVSAYEAVSGEIPIKPTTKLQDTDNTHAKKATEFFFWPESGLFDPDLTGDWVDWSFMSAVIFDSQLRLGQELEEAKITYGSAVASMATMLNAYAGIELHALEEKIVLNERPYDWHVYQQETGEYSAVNCMPSTVVMALMYQGATEVPSVEELRNAQPFNGLGWTDGLAENAMLEYGLEFTDSFDVELDTDKMLEHLDNGNVLYVMYREADSEEGHSSIIKGYWKLGDEVKFIVADPNTNWIGPFGYIDYVKDAETMKDDIERHLTRYFIIPPGL